MTRTVEDHLRSEYFELLPEVRRVAEELETTIRHCLLPISSKLDGFERIAVKSRVKDCESAVEALRRRQEGATFDRSRVEVYTLKDLKDLAGVRVLVFPRRRITEVDALLVDKYRGWVADPVRGIEEGDEPLALKYCGYCEASNRVLGEYQVVSMLTGLFWDVEHAAIYKPSPKLRGVIRSLEMRERTHDVLNSLRAFEEEFDGIVQRAAKSSVLTKK